MSDDICGPSNGTKNLRSHIERDRSLPQNRVVSGPSNGISSFRSPNSIVPAADGAFASFQHGNAFSGPDDLSRASNGHLAGNVAHPSYALHGVIAPSARTPASPTTASARRDLWSQEFAHSQLNGFVPSTSTATNLTGPAHDGRYSPRTALQSRMGTPLKAASIAPHVSSLPSPGNFFAMLSSPSTNLATGYHVSPYRPIMQQPFIDPAFTMVAAGSAVDTQESRITAATVGRSSQEDQAFNDAFMAFDEYEFQRKMADWMVEDGPVDTARAEQPAAEDQDLQQLAEDLETRLTAGDTSASPQEREQRDELMQQHGLAKAAQSILDAVATNENPKFKKSVFISTMRRIAAYDVVAKDNNLVDAKTGESLVTDASVEDDNGEEED